MKLTLTITDATPSEISHIASLLGSTAGAPVVSIAPIVFAPGENDDDGPVAAIAPGETDVNGLIWDERIHAGTKTKNADGRWKKRKGVDDATVTAVEAELRAGNGVQSASPVAPIPSVSVPATAPVAAPPAASPPVVAAPPAAPPVAPVVAPAPAGALDFGGIMQIISNGYTASPPLINDEWIAFFAQSVGVAQLPEIANDAAKIKQVYDLIKQHLPAMNLA